MKICCTVIPIWTRPWGVFQFVILIFFGLKERGRWAIQRTFMNQWVRRIKLDRRSNADKLRNLLVFEARSQQDCVLLDSVWYKAWYSLGQRRKEGKKGSTTLLVIWIAIVLYYISHVFRDWHWCDALKRCIRHTDPPDELTGWPDAHFYNQMVGSLSPPEIVEGSGMITPKKTPTGLPWNR